MPVSIDYEMNNTKFTILWSIQMVTVTILTIMFIRHNFCIKENRQQLSLRVRALSTIYIISYLIFFALFNPGGTVKISLFLFGVAMGAFGLLMLVRLYSAFEGTMYALNKKLLIFYLILLVIISFQWVILCICILTLPEDRHYYRYVAGNIWMIVFLSTILSLSILQQFAYKLFQLVISQRTSVFIPPSPSPPPPTTPTDDNDANAMPTVSTHVAISPSVDLNDRQEKLLATIVRYTVLGHINLITANMLLFTWACWWSALDPKRANSNDLWVIVNGNCSIIIQIFCVYLSFGSNKWMYYKVCKCCDRLCLVCFRKLAEKKILKRNMDKIVLSTKIPTGATSASLATPTTPI